MSLALIERLVIETTLVLDRADFMSLEQNSRKRKAIWAHSIPKQQQEGLRTSLGGHPTVEDVTDFSPDYGDSETSDVVAPLLDNQGMLLYPDGKTHSSDEAESDGPRSTHSDDDMLVPQAFPWTKELASASVTASVHRRMPGGLIVLPQNVAMGPPSICPHFPSICPHCPFSIDARGSQPSEVPQRTEAEAEIREPTHITVRIHPEYYGEDLRIIKRSPGGE